MSVIAFVQSKNNDGILIAKDGILVAKEEKANLKLKIEEKFNMFKKKKNRPFFVKYKNENIFFGNHKIVDKIGRNREFLIYWDKDENKELVNKTASLIEISDEFDIYNLPKQNRNWNLNSILLIGFIVVVFLILLNQ